MDHCPAHLASGRDMRWRRIVSHRGFDSPIRCMEEA